MTIYITGSTGFLGSNLVSHLMLNRPNSPVVLLRRKKGPQPYPDLQRQLESAHGALVHLAGKAHDIANQTNDAEYETANFGLTKYVFDQFMASELDGFIFVSSVKAVTDFTAGHPEEDAVAHPMTPYGQSKLRAEEYIRTRVSSDKKVYILRPCMIHGPRNRGNLNLLYQFVRLNIPYPLGAYSNSRSLLGVDNAVYVIDRLLFTDVESGVYNVADDEPLSTTEIVRIIAEALGRRAIVVHVPRWMIRIAAKLGDRLPLPLNSERLGKLTEDFIVTNSKLKEALGIQHLPTTAQDGLRDTVRAFSQECQEDELAMHRR